MSATKKTKHWIWAGAVVAILVSCGVGIESRRGMPPKRPGNVSPEAVFLPAPAVRSVFPRAQRGDWLNCWFDQEHELNRCPLSKLDGSLEYEGLFLPYEASGAVPTRGSRLDVAAAAARVQWLHFGERLLPTIHLRDETTLFPAEAYGDDPLHEDE